MEPPRFKTLVVVVPLRVRSPNVTNRFTHWRQRKKHVDREKGVTLAVVRTTLGRAPKPPVAVRLTRLGPKLFDGDNSDNSLKYVRDSVAEWVGVDDGDGTKIRFEYDQEVQKQYGVRIEVRPMDTDV